MLKNDGVVFLLDVDNTLLDNDAVAADLRAHLVSQFGQAASDEYWALFEELRQELGYADYLGALQRYRARHLHDTRLLEMSAFLIDYPFADRLYPGSLAVIEKMREWGTPVILSDGDVVFQPREIQRSGLWDAVEGRVLIYVHKEHELGEVERLYPASHYVLVDDKLRIDAAIKKIWGPKVTTVFPRQGHYAYDPKILATCPPADVTVEGIGDLLGFDLAQLIAPGSTQAPNSNRERGHG